MIGNLFVFFTIVLLIVQVYADLNQTELVDGRKYGCSYQATCTAGGVEGVCVSISSCGCSGTVTSNLCPGSDDIKCCTSNSCMSGTGTCEQTSLCSSQGGSSYAGYCTGPSDLQCCVQGGGGGGGVTRSEAIERAQSWVDAKVPYSQTSYYQGYRQDCSGYVSMAWELSQSYVTQDFPSFCTKISKSDLQKGDAILNPNEHVLLFDSWVDSDTFWEYAEHSSGTVASHDKTSYSYYASNGFYPCRYKNIQDGR